VCYFVTGETKGFAMKYDLFSDIDEGVLSSISAWIDTIPDKSKATIDLCSHGGLVFYGNAIYQKILNAQSRGVEFTCRIWGLAASCAADIALSCNRIEMASTAFIMIHSAWVHYSTPDDVDDEGINVANAAQLAVIHKRLPDYTEKDLEKDRWFKADEALSLGLVDYVFDDVSSKNYKLAAKYLAAYHGGVTMDDVKKEEVVEEKKEEVAEPEIERARPSVEDLLDDLVDKIAKLEERLMKLEGVERAACGSDNDKQNARLNAIQAKIKAICAPCSPKVEIKKVDKPISPKAELDDFNTRLSKYINEK
jgi:ATP-dependent protease ClpP protease subunit